MSDKWKYILMVMGLLTLSAAGVWQNSSVLLPVCAAEIAETSECVTEETGETEYETDIVETETEADTEESEIESETDITETETEGEADVPLQIRLAADGDLPGQPDIYRGHVMLSYAIEGEAYSGEEVVWKICCYRAGTVERLEFTGNAEELAKCEDEWGIEIKKSPEEVDSRLVFSMEGRYSVQVLIADQKVNPVESEICHFTIDRTEPDVRIREFSKAAGGYGIYGRRESPVVMVEVADVSGVSEITYAVKDTSGYERTGELMKEDRKRASAKWQGSIEPDLSEFADGRIEVRVSASDYAGNRSDPVILFLYTDTRDPEVTFSFDTSNAQNGKYYAGHKVLQITVREENFDTKCRPEITASNQDGCYFSGWKRNGGKAEGTIEFVEDGTYEVAFECSDLAGNLSNRQILPGFTIDQTAPELKIEGIGHHSSNNGTVAPGIRFYDANDGGNGVTLSLEEGTKGKIDIRTMIHTVSGEDGTQITFDNFKQDMDGIYVLSAKAEDLAGNQVTEKVMFSVNRNGSAYRFSSRTKQLLEKVFVSHAEDVVIYEDNVDWLTYSELSCSYNGTLIGMKAGKDYMVDKTGGEDKRKQYTYKIPAEFFRKEGVYAIHIYSEDRASNIAASDAVQKSPGFILDYTAPLITVANLEDCVCYREKEHEFTAVISDNLRLDSVRYYLDDELVKEYNRDELGQAEGVLYLKTGSSGEYQKIRIEAEDAAGNVAESKEWHVLVNPISQTKVKPKGRKKTMPVVREEYQQGVRREAVPDRHGMMPGIILLTGIAAAAVSLGRWYYRRKTEKPFTKG